MNDTAEGANRDLSEQEATRYNTIMAEVKTLNERIERGQRLEISNRLRARPASARSWRTVTSA